MCVAVTTTQIRLGFHSSLDFLFPKCTLIRCQRSVLPFKFATLILFSPCWLVLMEKEKKSLPPRPEFRLLKLISCRIGCRPIELFGKFRENFLRNATLAVSGEESGSWWRGRGQFSDLQLSQGRISFHKLKRPQRSFLLQMHPSHISTGKSPPPDGWTSLHGSKIVGLILLE